MRWKSYTFVFLQFACLGYLLATTDLFQVLTDWTSWIFFVWIGGLGLGIWAIAAMGLGQFRIAPDVRSGATLVQSGPYRVIRHPMYTALLLFCLGLLFSNPSAIRVGVYVLLTLTLGLKLVYEEGLLRARFPDYPVYEQRTKRLIPFIF